MKIQIIKHYFVYLANRYSKYLLLAVLVILYFLWQQRQDYRLMAASWKDAAEFKDQQMTTLKNIHGQVIAEQKTIVTENAKQIKALSAEIFSLSGRLEKRIKEVQALVLVKQEVRLPDTIKVPYIDTRKISPDSMVMAKNVIIPPKPFKVVQPFYTIAGKVLLENLLIDSIVFPNQVSFRIATQKKNFFSRSHQIVQVVNSNPYMQTLSTKSITLKPKVTAWNKWIKPVAAATVIGFLMYKF
jgi:hypothetical protein